MNPERVKAAKQRILATQMMHFTQDGVKYHTIPSTLDECLAESQADAEVNGAFYAANVDQI
jgi:hypothetical protein